MSIRWNPVMSSTWDSVARRALPVSAMAASRNSSTTQLLDLSPTNSVDLDVPD
jgi:hypothetical protein